MLENSFTVLCTVTMKTLKALEFLLQANDNLTIIISQMMGLTLWHLVFFSTWFKAEMTGLHDDWAASSSQVDPPEEGKQLLSAARGPGQIHTVVTSIGGHYEARFAANVSHSIMVDSKTGWKEIRSYLTKHRAAVEGGRQAFWIGSFALPVTNLMSDGNPQVETCVLGNHTAPLATAGSSQLCYTSHQFIPIRQRQVIPVDAA